MNSPVSTRECQAVARFLRSEQTLPRIAGSSSVTEIARLLNGSAAGIRLIRERPFLDGAGSRKWGPNSESNSGSRREFRPRRHVSILHQAHPYGLLITIDRKVSRMP